MYPAGVPGVTSRRLTLSSGLGVRVVESGPPDGDRVVLLHGWGCSAYLFHAVLPALADGGLRVMVPDLKGHGLSDKPLDRAGYDLRAMTAHAVEILDALGLDRTTLVGHSMGGAIALRLALEHPERIHSLIALNPVGLGHVRIVGLARAISPRWIAPVIPSLVPRWAVALVMHLTFARDRRMRGRDVDQYWAPSQFREFPLAAWHLLHAFEWDCWAPDRFAALRRLEHAPLIITGNDDRLVRMRDTERAACEANAELLALDGVGHVSPEEAPDIVAREILRVVRGTGVAS